MQGSKEVNVAFQGGGAKNIYYVGCHEAIIKHNLKPKNVAGSSGGALEALFLALGVTPEDYRKIMIKKPGEESVFGHTGDVQDFISAKKRQETFDYHYGILETYMKQEVRRKAGAFKAFFFQSLILPQIQGIINEMGAVLSSVVFNLRGIVDKALVPEMLLNGELVYGQKLVQMLEKLLDKYLEDHIPDSEKRKNVTMREFRAALGVNLIITGTDLTSKDVRILTAATSPHLPVKYAIRISTGFPFFFPPIYWKEEWGRYLDEDITGHKLVDGGWLLNLPTVLLRSPPYFQKKYLGTDPIPEESIMAFSFDLKNKFNEEEEKIEDPLVIQKKIASLPDDWPPILDPAYLEAVKRGRDFMHNFCVIPDRTTSVSNLNIPGFQLLKELLDSKKDIQEVLMGKLFFGDTLLLESSAVETLNFALDGVNADEEVEKAGKATEEFLAHKFG